MSESVSLGRPAQVEWLSDVGVADVPRVGGKNASLGELISELAHVGVRVPDGFATTADAYRAFVAHNWQSVSDSPTPPLRYAVARRLRTSLTQASRVSRKRS